MCGIVGLLVRDPTLEASLGAMVAPMVSALGTRGPDSTGIALYSLPDEGRCRISLRRASPDLDWETVCSSLAEGGDGDTQLAIRGDGDIGLLSSSGSVELALAGLLALFPDLKVTGYGHAVEVIKDVGDGADVCRRYHIDQRQGYLALGHTPDGDRIGGYVGPLPSVCPGFRSVRRAQWVILEPHDRSAPPRS